MKIKGLKIVLVLGILISGMVFTSPVLGNIQGSEHDFSGNWGQGRICEPCHTPHNSDISVTGSPLWNHEVTIKVWPDLYSSTTFDAASTIAQPTESKLCLSCHDGTVEVDSFGGNTGTAFIDAEHKIESLQRMHPIGFVYDSALATTDGELFDPTATSSGLGGTIEKDMLGAALNMSCAACHDVHDKNGIDKLLVVDNLNSALCLTCHDK